MLSGLQTTGRVILKVKQMKSSDQLFQLIKSLSKGEKRNVKLFARLQEGDKKYLQLFDVIDRQTEYDEDAVMREFEGERFLKQFSVAKNYLYNFILKTLDVYTRDSQSESFTELHQIQILIQKGLYEQAHKIVRKARFAAESRERFQELLHLLNFERDIMKRMNKVREFEAFIGEIGEKEKEVADKIQNLMAFTHLQDQIQLIMRKSGAARTEADLVKIKTFGENPLLLDSSMAKSQRALIRHYNLSAEYFWFVGNISRALEMTEKAIAAYEKNAAILEEENGKYITRLANLGVLQNRAGQLDKMTETLEKLKHVKTYNRNEVLHVFERYYMFKLMYLIEHGADPMIASSLAEEMEEKLERYHGQMSHATEFELLFLLSSFWVNASQPSRALTLINKVLNEPKSEVRVDIQCMVRILNLIIHFELGNRDMLESLTQAAYRFIYKRNRLFEYEKTALKFFSQVSKQNEEDFPLEALQDLKQNLEAIRTSQNEKRVMLFFDIESWVEAKLSGLKMHEVKMSKKMSNTEVVTRKNP